MRDHLFGRVGKSLTRPQALLYLLLLAPPAYSGIPAVVYYARKQQRRTSASAIKNQTMITLIKIAVALAIGFAVVNPTSTPKAQDASCNCSADA